MNSNPNFVLVKRNLFSQHLKWTQFSDDSDFCNFRTKYPLFVFISSKFCSRQIKLSHGKVSGSCNEEDNWVVIHRVVPHNCSINKVINCQRSTSKFSTNVSSYKFRKIRGMFSFPNIWKYFDFINWSKYKIRNQ